ncbi:Uncharacterized protein dnm_052140 [Desulfonema magnum]|uniref:Uncharacterized protein n=1 Tax=Desulfonema magnum TaxID=45655 RepID=A0A975BPE3_9BACT|nr:Uncharacterized protein dnm_052140 [Desulfonema magnum]
MQRCKNKIFALRIFSEQPRLVILSGVRKMLFRKCKDAKMQK